MDNEQWLKISTKTDITALRRKGVENNHRAQKLEFVDLRILTRTNIQMKVVKVTLHVTTRKDAFERNIFALKVDAV